MLLKSGRLLTTLKIIVYALLCLEFVGIFLCQIVEVTDRINFLSLVLWQISEPRFFLLKLLCLMHFNYCDKCRRRILFLMPKRQITKMVERELLVGQCILLNELCKYSIGSIYKNVFKNKFFNYIV